MDVTALAAEAWWRRYGAAAEGTAQRAYALATAKAADDLAAASKSLQRSAGSLAEASQASSNAAARTPYLNGHVDLSQAAYHLDTAAERLRSALAEAQRGGLMDAASRASARLAEVEQLHSQVAAAYAELPHADEVAASSKQVAPLMGPLVIAVLRFDGRLAEIALAL